MSAYKDKLEKEYEALAIKISMINTTLGSKAYRDNHTKEEYDSLVEKSTELSKRYNLLMVQLDELDMLGE